MRYIEIAKTIEVLQARSFAKRRAGPREEGSSMSSLKELAQECGVSVATVSKALNGQPDISAATRNRIREAARRM